MSAVQASFQGRLGPFELDVAFTLPRQGVTALVGPSGCGKTSVLRCLAGLERLPGQCVVHGQVWQDAQRFLPPHRRAVGYVFQEASLFPHLSVRGNLDYARKRARSGSGPGVAAVVDVLGLERLLERAPTRLSGGERQRVAVARALMSAPELLLMDEPLAALDRESKHEILPYLERLHAELAIPVLYVSHDITEVERLADQLVLLEAGRVRASGALPTLLADPALPFARAPEAAAVLAGSVVGYDEAYGLSELRVGGAELVVPGRIGAPGEQRRVRIAASDVALCRPPAPAGLSILNALPGRIVAAEPLQSHQTNVFLDLGADARLMARITRKSWEALGLRVGDEVVALVKSVSLVDAA